MLCAVLANSVIYCLFINCAVVEFFIRNKSLYYFESIAPVCQWVYLEKHLKKILKSRFEFYHLIFLTHLQSVHIQFSEYVWLNH